jgi:diguanylate cyclase (GGDEF)-like protein
MQFKFLNSKTDKRGDLEVATSSTWLTTYYSVALLAIGCIALISHLVQERSLESGQGIAATINSSGRQRMLSQRIESLAEQYHRGDSTARDEMVKAIDEFEKTHDRLSGDRALHDTYFAGSNSLDKEVRAYIRSAREVSLLRPDDPAIPALLAEMSYEARSPLLTALNEVVSIHQKNSEEKLARLKVLQWVLLVIMGVTLTLEVLLIFRPLVQRIVRLSTYLQHQATIDQLTGVNNRRGFNEQTTIEVHRFLRYRRPMALIAADIDHFKSVNDTFGHEAGDAVLKAVAAVLTSQMRPTDVLARMGGEEFAVILPETSLEAAAAVAERLRRSVAGLQIQHQSKTITVTSSFGVAAVQPDSPGIDSAMDIADKQLYLAKQAGRNRVMWESAAGTGEGALG